MKMNKLIINPNHQSSDFLTSSSFVSSFGFGFKYESKI